MKKQFVNNKYQFFSGYGDSGIDYSELVTVPDLVLSMQEIYEKYAVRGDIAGLANNTYPHVTDDLDLDDPSVDFVPEETVDILYESRRQRSAASSPANPAVEDKPVAEGVDKDPQDPAKPKTDAGSDAGSDAGYE